MQTCFYQGNSACRHAFIKGIPHADMLLLREFRMQTCFYHGNSACRHAFIKRISNIFKLGSVSGNQIEISKLFLKLLEVL